MAPNFKNLTIDFVIELGILLTTKTNEEHSAFGDEA